ncbi:MAG: riboflavin synthase [Candidatus Diapherotrites archaeon]|uniref:Riboflavin synthase n=1 Tax=Candidatus Iainarchaeum sp. TaxID=3101447 RepID=A0A2D6LNY8_9ARCH|nr:riboflavin synthase [Candidatus Diapherotrites archaeon]|tara:strand:- start:9797 stop:10276 length:480 start_codon:yes stop_codon:yes gene_type:complete
MKTKIAIVDTMFARGDMGKVAIETMEKNAKENNWEIEIMKKTVPGIKDIPVALLNLLEQGCQAGIALGMPGAAKVDKTCAHEASLGIQEVQLMTRKTVLEVFVHEDEAKDDKDLAEIMHNRASKHALNLLWVIFKPEELEKRAGSGERQGRENTKSVGL